MAVSGHSSKVLVQIAQLLPAQLLPAQLVPEYCLLVHIQLAVKLP